MTVQEIALDLLSYIGVTSLDPEENTNDLNQRGLQSVDLPMAARAITAAIQEIFDISPTAISEQRYADVIRAPKDITFTATKYSRQITDVVGWEDWMDGCTVKVSGDGLDNEFISESELLRPYPRASGIQSGTVYGDAIALPANIRNVLEPVESPNVWRLSASENRDNFRMWNSPFMTGARGHGAGFTSYYTTQNKSIGEPVVYLVEPRHDPNLSYLRLFLRFNPMPSQDYPITFRVKVKPPIITAQDIGSDVVDPMSIVPIEWHESILLPFALKRWCKHPAFDNEGAKQMIMSEYQTARMMLEGFAPRISSVEAQYR